MSLIFQDWSKLVPRSGIQERYKAKGWRLPEKGRYLVKVYPSNQDNLAELKKWAEERGLRIHESRHPHIDLLGPNLEYASSENILNPEETRELIKKELFNGKESPTATIRSPEMQ